MRTVAAFPYRRLALAVCSFVLVAGSSGWSVGQDAPPAEEKKPGFFKRMSEGVTGIFKKDEPAPAPPPPSPEPKAAEKSKASASKKAEPTASKSGTKSKAPSQPKPKVSAAPKPKTSTTKSEGKPPAPAKKEEAKPAETASKTPTVSAPSMATKKSDEPKPTATEKPTSSDISEAFGSKNKMEVPPATPAKPKETAPKKQSGKSETASNPKPETQEDKDTSPSVITPALPASDGSWEIVKLGHDYVTADSIQRFYRFASLKVDGNHIWLRSPTIIMKATVGSQELLINNIKFILSYPAAINNGKALFSRVDLCKLIDPVLRPSHITTSDVFDTVVIDAGHGGHDAGARGIYGYEKDFALKMAFAVRDALNKRGLKTVLTRDDDTFISLGGRFAVANATPRSIFISLHFNSGGAAASGIETFALSPEGTANTQLGRSSDVSSTSFRTGNKRDSENIALATAVHAMVVHRFKLIDRGIKRARWSVLTGCSRPSILFEGGFVTNSQECRLIASQTYRDAIATAIGDAVVNYRKALQPRVVQPSMR